MKKITVLIISLSITCATFAQTQTGSISDVQQKPSATPQTDKKFDPEKLRFGGSLGAQFGNVVFVDVSPSVGYQFTNRLQAGLGLTYNYYAINDITPKISMSVFGVNPYVKFNILNLKAFQLFARAEFGLLNYNTNFVQGLYGDTREWVPYPLIGGGVLLPVGAKGGLSLHLMWDVYEKNASIYGQNPIFQLGFWFGL